LFNSTLLQLVDKERLSLQNSGEFVILKSGRPTTRSGGQAAVGYWAERLMELGAKPRKPISKCGAPEAEQFCQLTSLLYISLNCTPGRRPGPCRQRDGRSTGSPSPIRHCYSSQVT